MYIVLYNVPLQYIDINNQAKNVDSYKVELIDTF